jgi:hypothetical protein
MTRHRGPGSANQCGVPDFFHFGSCEFVGVIRLSREKTPLRTSHRQESIRWPESALPNAVPHIVGSRPDKNMIWIYTELNVTRMAGFISLSWPVIQQEPMGLNIFGPVPELPISPSAKSAVPYPARRSFGDFCHESL